MAVDRSGNVVGVLPSVLVKPPLTHGQLCSLPFCDRGEAIAINPQVERELIKAAQELAAKNNAGYAYRAAGDSNSFKKDGLQKGLKVSMLLDLPGTSEILLAGFKSKLRSQIKKAEKNQLEYELGREKQHIDDFYQVFTSNMRDLGSPTHSKGWFEEIVRNYRENMILSIVKYKSQPIGAGLVLFNGETAAIPWASTKRDFNKLAPNMMLYWSLLKYAADKHYKIFDFGRSSYDEGTYKFKQQWGACPVPINWKTYGRKQEPVPSNTTSIHKSNFRVLAESVWRHLPLPMTVLIGSSIRKYISL